MARADDLRAELAIAELEEKLVRLKDEGPSEELAAVKDELRYARWVRRGGPAQEAELLEEHARLAAERERLLTAHPDLADHLVPLAAPHTNRHVADMYRRWLGEQEG